MFSLGPDRHPVFSIAQFSHSGLVRGQCGSTPEPVHRTSWAPGKWLQDSDMPPAGSAGKRSCHCSFIFSSFCPWATSHCCAGLCPSFAFPKTMLLSFGTPHPSTCRLPPSPRGRLTARRIFATLFVGTGVLDCPHKNNVTLPLGHLIRQPVGCHLPQGEG